MGNAMYYPAVFWVLLEKLQLTQRYITYIEGKCIASSKAASGVVVIGPDSYFVVYIKQKCQSQKVMLQKKLKIICRVSFDTVVSTGGGQRCSSDLVCSFTLSGDENNNKCTYTCMHACKVSMASSLLIIHLPVCFAPFSLLSS